MVISDIRVPRMDGEELCRRLRGDSRFDATYIVLFTANFGHGQMARGLDLGADECLSKPFDLPELEARLRAGLRISGTSPDGKLVEIVELRDHPFMLGCQFHPEYKSRPTRPHPLFQAFVKAAVATLHDGEQRPLPLEAVAAAD